MAPSTRRISAGVVLTALIALFSFATSIGAARFELSLKEDREVHDSTLGLVRRDHTAELRAIRDTILAERTRRDLQQVRDSAQMSIVIGRLTEVACDQNPRRRYCR